MKRTWALLRHLMDPTSPRTIQSTRITKLARQLADSNPTWPHALTQQYAPAGSPEPLHQYTGRPDEPLDLPILEAEVQAVLHDLRLQSAPGGERITNKMLRNLDDPSIKYLTDLFNAYWEAGNLPPPRVYSRRGHSHP